MHRSLLRLLARETLAVIGESGQADQPDAVYERGPHGRVVVNYVPGRGSSYVEEGPPAAPAPTAEGHAPRRGRPASGCTRDVLLLLCDARYRTVREIRAEMEIKQRHYSEQTVRNHLAALVKGQIVDQDGDHFGLTDH